jgi:hypothetical protein
MTERGIGTELIQTEVSKILFDELNDELDRQQELWADRDEEWQLLTGQTEGFVILEHIEPENFYRGHRPSLVKQPIPIEEKYPNVSVMAYQARPTGDIVDQGSNFSIVLDIEILVRSKTSESEADSRIQRTGEAVHQVLVRNENLNGLSFGWENDPVIQYTDIYLYPSEHSYGEDWFWQGSRFRYNLTRHSSLPS